MSETIRAKRGLRSKIEERVKEGVCIHEGCGSEPHRRGVCSRHYTQYRTRYLSLSKPQRVEFEANAIHEGLILAAGETREITTDNPFAGV